MLACRGCNTERLFHKPVRFVSVPIGPFFAIRRLRRRIFVPPSGVFVPRLAGFEYELPLFYLPFLDTSKSFRRHDWRSNSSHRSIGACQLLFHPRRRLNLILSTASLSPTALRCTRGRMPNLQASKRMMASVGVRTRPLYVSIIVVVEN